MIDVCIVTYGNEKTIEGLLASVEARRPGSKVSIWDNSPNSRTVEVIDRYAAKSALDIRVHHDGENIGFGYGCNQLAEWSAEEWLMFLNPDAEVRSWPSDRSTVRSSHLVGAAVYLPDGAVQETFGQDRTVWGEFSARVLRQRPKTILEEGIFATDFVSGAAFLVDRVRFLECGGFDVGRYFMYYEDLDLGRRWRLAGGTVEVDPAWRVYHLGGFSAKQNHALALVRSFKSARAYHQRWSRAARLFRAVCIVEALIKLLLAIPKGHVGNTSLRTQLQYFGYLASGRLIQK